MADLIQYYFLFPQEQIKTPSSPLLRSFIQSKTSSSSNVGIKDELVAVVSGSRASARQWMRQPEPRDVSGCARDCCNSCRDHPRWPIARGGMRLGVRAPARACPPRSRRACTSTRGQRDPTECLGAWPVMILLVMTILLSRCQGLCTTGTPLPSKSAACLSLAESWSTSLCSGRFCRGRASHRATLFSRSCPRQIVECHRACAGWGA